MPNQRGLAPITVVLIAALAILAFIVLGKIKVVTNYFSDQVKVKGILIAKDDNGDSKSGSSDSGGSAGSGSGSSGSSISGPSGSKDSDDKDSGSGGSGDSNTPKPTSGPSTTKFTTPEGVKIKEQITPKKQKTEIKFGEGEKIKVRVEEGRTRIDVYRGGVKVRYEIRDDRVVVKAETGEGATLPEQELFKIKERLDKTGIKVATEGGKLLLVRGSVGALSNFPVQIDLNNNQLIASTSAGARVLTVLPDVAVQNLIAANVISKLGAPFIREAVQSGQVTSVKDVVTLGEKNGVPVYEVLGLREQKLLGFIPITTQVRAVVSAETGQLVSTEQSLLAQLVDLLSP